MLTCRHGRACAGVRLLRRMSLTLNVSCQLVAAAIIAASAGACRPRTEEVSSAASTATASSQDVMTALRDSTRPISPTNRRHYGWPPALCFVLSEFPVEPILRTDAAING